MTSGFPTLPSLAPFHCCRVARHHRRCHLSLHFLSMAAVSVFVHHHQCPQHLLPLPSTTAADVVIVVVILVAIHPCHQCPQSLPLPPLLSTATTSLSVADCQHGVVGCCLAYLGSGKARLVQN